MYYWSFLLAAFISDKNLGIAEVGRFVIRSGQLIFQGSSGKHDQ